MEKKNQVVWGGLTRIDMRLWKLGAGLLAGVVAVNIGLLAWFGWQVVAPSVATAGGPPGELPSPFVQIVNALSPLGSVGAAPEEFPTAKGIVNILIMGIDQRFDQAGEPTRSDVMMVLRVDFDNNQAHLLSFPRDIWVPIPEIDKFNVAEGRINQAYYYGEKFDLPGGGPELAKKAVALNFGIPVDYYVLVTFDGFKQIVDTLGGIDIDVPERVYDATFPTDDYGYMELEIEAGLQHMDGAQALRYARTRHQDADTKRILRQQLVLLAIRDKALQLDAVSKWPELYRQTKDSFQTDIPVPTMVSFALAGQNIPRENIQTYAIEPKLLIPWTTSGGAHVWIPRREAIGELISQFMTFE